jgi:hypothetical protein
MSRLKLLFCLILFSSITLAQSRSAVSQKAIGQVVASGVRMDGVVVPSGTALFSPTMLKTAAQPGIVRLTTGDILQLGANSSAAFQKSGKGEITVAVNSGTLSFRVEGGRPTTVASPASYSFPQRRTGVEVLEAPTGVSAVLMQQVLAGGTELIVNDASRFNPDARIMIRSRDGSTFEVHYVKSIVGNRIILDSPLGNGFQPEDIVLQGCECDQAVGAPADGIVGALTQPADKGDKTLTIQTMGFFDPQAPTLIKRKDGSIQEVHRIKSISGNTLTLEGGLKFAYMPGDMIIQGCLVPPLPAGGWNWTRAFLYGTLAGGGAGAVTYASIEDLTWEDCSECFEKFGYPKRP